MTGPLNLLNNTTRVETPFVKVQIGDFVCGVYSENKDGRTYPNFTQSLNVTKN